MKNNSLHRRQGSALLLTLLIVSLLMVVVLSFVVYVRLQLREASNQQNLIIARQNAKLGLNIAVSQLQKYAGADQRVTVPATTVYPKKDVVTATGDLYDNGTFGYRSFANTAANRSGRANGTTYLTDQEREDWSTALATWWNSNDGANDISTGKNPYWTGIFDSSYRVDRFSGLNRNNNNVTYSPMPRQDYESLGEDAKFGEFARVGYPGTDDSEINQNTKQLPIWLISGNESKDPGDADYFRPDQDLNNQNLDPDLIMTIVNRAAPGIEQISSGTPDDDPVDGLAGRVTVPKVEVNDSSGNDVVGHYAYWVSDESTKANFSVRDPFENSTPGSSEYRNRLQVPQRVGWDRMEGFSQLFDNMSEAERENINNTLAKVASSNQIALVDPEFGDQNNDPDVSDSPVYRNFHHITAYSQGLLTNTARGGLRRDLTAFLERNNSTLPSEFIADPDLYEDDPRLAAFGGNNTGFPNPPGGSPLYDYGIPTWDEVREWYQNEATNSTSTIPPSKNAHPMITYVNVHMGFTYRASDQALLFHVAPIIVLWNPYDVAIDGADYLLDIGVNPNIRGFSIENTAAAPSDGPVGMSAHSHMTWDGNTGRVRNNWFSPFSHRDFQGADRPFEQPSNSGYKPLDELLRFTIPSSDSGLAAGESKIYTIATDATDWTPSSPRVTMSNLFIPNDPSGPGKISFPAIQLTGPLPATGTGLSTLRIDSANLTQNSFISPYIALGIDEPGGSDLPDDQFQETDNLLFRSMEMGEIDQEVVQNFLEGRSIPYENPNNRSTFQAQNTQTQDSTFMFPFARSWLQPFTGDGEDPFRMHSQLPALANFNITRPATAHPSIDAFRSLNPSGASGNSDNLRRLVYMQGAPFQPEGSPNITAAYQNIAWDEEMSPNGSDAFSLITFYANETIDGASVRGQPILRFRNARRADSEILSLGRLQEINLSRYFWQPFAPVGNANAPIYVDREAIAGLNGQELEFTRNFAGNSFSPSTEFRFQGNRNEYQLNANISGREYLDRVVPANLSVDMSYLLNESLWDDFFFSTILNNNPNPNTELPNSRMRFTGSAYNAGGSIVSEATDFETAAAYLRYNGPLNVNTTSVEAWKALLTAFRDLELGNNPAGTVPIARTLDPFEDSIDFSDDGDTGAVNSDKDYSKIVGGLRYLEDIQIQRLAERIVDEVRLRGPFSSIADFVNRRLVGPDRSGGNYSDARSQPGFMDDGYDPFRGLQGLNGTLQRAINVSGINGGVNHPDPANEDRVYSVRIQGDGDNNPKHSIEPSMNSHVDMEHVASAPVGEAGQLFNGAPSFVTQGDLLAMIGPALTARGDTFLIRTYGDSTSPTSGEIAGRAWIEAVVQRTIEPVSPDGSDKFRYTDSFGRRFEIVSVRWLSEEEI